MMYQFLFGFWREVETERFVGEESGSSHLVDLIHSRAVLDHSAENLWIIVWV